MFGSKGKKLQQTLDVAYGLLTQQVDLGDAEESSAHRRLATPYALGYVYGFADTLTHRAGVTDEDRVLAQLLLVYARLFGVEQGSTIFGSCLQGQSDPQFVAGRAAGVSDVMAWLSSRGRDVPSALAEYLQVAGRFPARTAVPQRRLSADARRPPGR